MIIIMILTIMIITMITIAILSWLLLLPAVCFTCPSGCCRGAAQRRTLWSTGLRNDFRCFLAFASACAKYLVTVHISRVAKFRGLPCVRGYLHPSDIRIRVGSSSPKLASRVGRTHPAGRPADLPHAAPKPADEVSLACFVGIVCLPLCRAPRQLAACHGSRSTALRAAQVRAKDGRA